MTSALLHMHTLPTPIIHRDIKLENYLLTADGTVKLCDFGSATTTILNLGEVPLNQIEAIKEDMERNTTPQSRTPEMLDLYCKMQLGVKGDIWVRDKSTSTPLAPHLNRCNLERGS